MKCSIARLWSFWSVGLLDFDPWEVQHVLDSVFVFIFLWSIALFRLWILGVHSMPVSDHWLNLKGFWSSECNACWASILEMQGWLIGLWFFECRTCLALIPWSWVGFLCALLSLMCVSLTLNCFRFDQFKNTRSHTVTALHSLWQLSRSDLLK